MSGALELQAQLNAERQKGYEAGYAAGAAWAGNGDNDE